MQISRGWMDYYGRCHVFKSSCECGRNGRRPFTEIREQICSALFTTQREREKVKKSTNLPLHELSKNCYFLPPKMYTFE